MENVAPLLLTIVVCDRVIFDRITGMPSIINIVQNINAQHYPVRHNQILFFCELTNGHGNTKLRVRLIDMENQDKVIFEQGQVVDFKDVKQIVTVAVNMMGIVFHHTGEYRFQLFANETLLGERSIICRQVNLPPAGATPINPPENQ
ncbi:MAG: hypothetical protein JW749_03155 [Sedimentisphaerales bacterium]|nr:hypothetical protein [Sedimentisphaerales bacterium]